jgi:uncharacterized phage protein gp47/JayE
MKLPLQTFTSLVQGMATATQSASRQPLDLSTGSTLRAVLEANASIGLWLQWLILRVLQMTRAASSTGDDLDSWAADFSLSRLPARSSSGLAAFSRNIGTYTAFVPVGALIRTNDAAQTFTVVQDTSHPLWNDVQNGYLLPAGTLAGELPVQALVPGSAGNVQPGTLSMLATAMPGIDAVSNSAAFCDGMDAESDAALRARFQSFLASQSRATKAAIGYAISSVQQGLAYAITENVDALGNPSLGTFVVTVDDGSGAPSDSLISAVYTAVDAMRPLGTTFSVRAPTLVPVTVSIATQTKLGADRNAAIGKLANAVSNYINTLPIGAGLLLTRVAQLAYDADTGIEAVGAILLNGVSNDLTPGTHGVLKTKQIVVN